MMKSVSLAAATITLAVLAQSAFAGTNPPAPAAAPSKTQVLTKAQVAPSKLVATGGGNIVAAGGGNLVATGGGNFGKK